MKPSILTVEFERVIDRAKVLSSKRAKPCALFVEGGAGVGKTTLNKLLHSQLASCLQVAPTGVAAVQLGGSTIHRVFNFPDKVLQPSLDRKNSYPSPVLRKTKAIIVDEAGMVRADMVDGMDHYLRKATRRDMPFGGVLMIFVGDPYQLPPVIGSNEEEAWQRQDYKSEFFFDANVFEGHPLERHSLTKVFRQSNEAFIGVLNRLREGKTTDADLTLLNSRSDFAAPAGTIVLSARRDGVDVVNAMAMSSLPGEELHFEGRMEGAFKPEDTQAEERLTLKPGSMVMLLNNTDEWQNGSIGLFEEVSGGKLRIRLQSGSIVNVAKDTWEKKRYKLNATQTSIEQEVIGTFKQFPVRLAHGITIHKSQGQTLERAIVDLGGRAVAPSSAYVALSRLRSLEGLYLKRPIRREDCHVSPRVVEFMAQIKHGQAPSVVQVQDDLFSAVEAPLRSTQSVRT